MLKLNHTFFSDSKHTSDLWSSADSSESSLVNDRIGLCAPPGFTNVYTFTCAKLDDHHAVTSEREPGIGSVNSQLFALLLDSKEIAYCLVCLSSTQVCSVIMSFLITIYARLAQYKNDRCESISLAPFISLFFIT